MEIKVTSYTQSLLDSLTGIMSLLQVKSPTFCDVQVLAHLSHITHLT